MNVTGLAETAGAGSTDRWVRSSNMDQLISRRNRDLQHFDEDDWTILGWQDRREFNGTGTRGKSRNKNGARKTNTVIGVVYVGVLVVLMLIFLT